MSLPFVVCVESQLDRGVNVSREEEELTVNTLAASPAPHFRLPLTIPHNPLLEVRVKPVLVFAAVNVAHVPEVNQVPLLMMQPVCIPLTIVTSR